MSQKKTPPLLAMSPVSIPNCPFDECFRVVAEAGFQGIGLRYDRLETFLAAGGTIRDVQDLKKRFGLQIAEAGFLAEWQFQGLPLVSRRQRTGAADETPAMLLQRLNRFFEYCEQLECQNVTTAPALRQVGDLDQAAEEFGQLCDRAKPYGLRLCLEFMGSAPQVKDLATAERMVTAAGRTNGGVLIDTFLFYEGASEIEDVRKVPVAHVFNVQLADAKPLPRERLNMLEDRLFPGEGVAPVRQIISILSERGYAGWWTVELFNPDYAAMDPLTVARRSYETALASFASAAQSRMAS